jgi:NADH-ubiquinone oxidoreductase chain 6
MFTLIFITSLIISLSSAILLSINPLSLGIAILRTALLLTLIYSLILTSWVSFLIFLIYIGGILVIFAYFVALTPNQQTTPIIYIPISITIFISILTILIIHITPSSLSMKNLYINSFYLEKNIQLLLILALILLFTIVVVVKLVTNNKGPLRPFINYV